MMCGFLRQMAAIIGSKNRRGLLKSINTPTLIIHGDIDPLIKVKNAYSAKDLIQFSELEIISEWGTCLMRKHIQSFKINLLVFLSR